MTFRAASPSTALSATGAGEAFLVEKDWTANIYTNDCKFRPACIPVMQYRSPVTITYVVSTIYLYVSFLGYYICCPGKVFIRTPVPIKFRQ